MQCDTLLMSSIFYIFRGVKWPALNKAVAMATSRSRTSKRKQKEEDKQQLTEDEDIKPLIVCKNIKKLYIKKSEKELVVDVETLTFRPAEGRLQTARRGRPFMPGNLHGHHRGGGLGGGVAVGTSSESIGTILEITVDDNTKGDDAVKTDDSTNYNEWLAAQRLVGLSLDRPKEGDIRKLHEKENKSQDNIQSVDDKKEVDYATNVEEQSSVKSKEKNVMPPRQKQQVYVNKKCNLQKPDELKISYQILRNIN